MHTSLLHKKHILILFGSLDLGGAERQGLVLARHLKEQEGSVVTVWGLGNRRGVVADICESWQIPWRNVWLHWGLRRRLPHLLRLALRMWRERPDILLAYTKVPNVAAALLWRICKIRLYVWNQSDAGLLLEPTLLNRNAIRRVSHFISNADIGKSYLVETFGINSADIELIRNGISLTAPEKTRSGWREHLKLNDDQIMVTMVANLSKYKDHATLLTAWRQLLSQWREGTPPLLVLAGRYDDTAEALRAQAERFGITEHVHFLGVVTDISGLLAAADICVHSSVSEGIPNAVLEAMYSGLPVAGSDIPGIREAVGEAGSKYLAAPGDASALADILVQLVNNRELRVTHGKVMQQRAKDLFGEERMCTETVAYLVKLLKVAV